MTWHEMNSRALRIWVDLMLLICIAWSLTAVTREALRLAEVRSDVVTVSREARRIHDAFVRFHERNGHYPRVPDESGTTDPLELLARRGYHRGPVTAKLTDGRLDAYLLRESPRQDEFWLEMTLDRDPTVRFLIARSDDAPLGGGKWRDGAFIYRDGKLRPL